MRFSKSFPFIAIPYLSLPIIIRKVLSSVENSEEMLGCLNKIENFLAEMHCQHRKQTKIYQLFKNNIKYLIIIFLN